MPMNGNSLKCIHVLWFKYLTICDPLIRTTKAELPMQIAHRISILLQVITRTEQLSLRYLLPSLEKLKDHSNNY